MYFTAVNFLIFKVRFFVVLMTNLSLIWEANLKRLIYMAFVFIRRIAQQFSAFNDLRFSKYKKMQRREDTLLVYLDHLGKLMIIKLQL